MIASTIGHYKILEKLGEGGMGIVYKAHDTKLNRSVALKFLPDRVTKDEAARTRFVLEAQAAAGLNHPHICTIHGVEDHGGSLFMVMEYVEGGTLRDKIPIKKTAEAITVAIQIGEALQEAHTRGVVHRDIKADNIMLTSRGEAKVMDFGLARLKGVLKLTRSSSTVGTIGYMAPEQIQGGEVDHRSDIFSFGVLLFELLTGKLPFRGEHEAAMMYSIVNEQPENLRALAPDIPDALVRIIEKALEKNPDERYQTAADFVADLKRSKRDSSRVAFESQPHPALRTVSSTPRFIAKYKHLALGIAALAAVISALVILQPFGSNGTPGKRTLVVLPFTNQSEPDREYFSDGITEEITTRLSSLSGIGIIARSSAWQYKGTQKSVKEIGKELGIDYVLMGTVRWSQQADQSFQVRVRPELIDVRTGLQVWGNTFDAPFKNAFAIQSDIAQQVAQTLDIKLLSPEASALEQNLTSVPEAYDFYLQGFDYENRSFSKTDGQIAIQHYERAVTLDPTFAAAYARLAKMHAQTYWFFYDRTSERIEKSRRAAEKALSLAPKLSVAHEAMAWYHYHTKLDYDAAIREFTIAIELQPNNPGASYGLAAVYRRIGNMEESLKYWRKAVAWNPRDSEMERQYGETLTLSRQYEEAMRRYEIAGRLAPDNVSIHSEMAKSLILWKGDLNAANEIVQKGLRYGRPTSGEDESIKHILVEIRWMSNDTQGAIDATKSFISEHGLTNQFVYYPTSLIIATIEESRDPRQARAMYLRAVELIQGRLKEFPDDERAHSALGIAYAGLGRFEEAIQHGERACNLLPLEKEAWRGSYRLIDLAHIYTASGKHDKAVDVLERLLSVPSDLSGHWLRLDPRWKALRGNKRFEALTRMSS